MKTAQQIIGLPVVSIFDGNEIGKVKNVIINASKGTIDFFVIDSGVRSLSGGVIPADRVLGIGEYALTIQQPDDISDIVKIPAAIELMQKNITVRGTRVLTRKGSLLGESGDIYISDEETYDITGVEFIPEGSESSSGIIPRNSIITFGKDLLVVNDDFIDQLIDTSNAIDTIALDEKKNNILATDDYDSEGSETGSELNTDEFIAALDEKEDDIFKIDDFVGDSIKNDDILIADEDLTEEKSQSQESEFNFIDNGFNTNISDEEEDTTLSSADLFEQRQREYLIGKKVSKAIHDASGGILADTGDLITDALIQTVKEGGKLIELVMNYED